MGPGWSEDAKCDHEHQKVDSLRCETGNIKQATPVLRHERASQKKLSTAKMGEPLSDASVVALRSLLTRIDVAVSIIGDCILTADNSKAIEPVSFANYSELKGELEVVAGVIVSYIEINKEHDTVAVIDHTNAMVDNACKQCTKLCELVNAFHA